MRSWLSDGSPDMHGRRESVHTAPARPRARCGTVLLIAALALAACSQRPEIVVRESPDASPSPSDPSPSAPADPASPSPAPTASIDYSAYNVCSASVTRPAPPAGGRQTLRIRSNLAGAKVTAVAVYGAATQSLAGTTDAEGRTEIGFRILGGVRSGTAVRVDISVAPSTHCSTGFSVG